MEKKLNKKRHVMSFPDISSYINKKKKTNNNTIMIMTAVSASNDSKLKGSSSPPGEFPSIRALKLV